MPSPAQTLRLAEVLGALSLATDLANGNPLETALRTCLLAVELARGAGGSEQEVADAYDAAMLRYVGCTAFAPEEAAAMGDDIASKQLYAPVDFGRKTELLAPTLLRLGRGTGPLKRARVVAGALVTARRTYDTMARSTCEVAVRLAARLGMGAGVTEALGQLYERWDGKGAPGDSEGESLSFVARVLHVACAAEVHHRLGGAEAARDMVRRRGGSHFDPRVARAFEKHAPELLGRLEAPSVWDAVLAAEPGKRPAEDAARLEDVARAFADFVDLKSPYTLGHSSGVAALAEASGRAAGLDEATCTSLRRAGLLHDLGRVSVPTNLWDKPGPLNAAEWERVRLHPYYTERVLARSPLLAPLGALAGAHHERLDGSGYHRNAPAALLTLPARILAAADCYHALTEARPHRPAHTPDDAARELEAEVSARRLDAEASRAVLEAAGHRARRKRGAWPAGLSDREVEVLRLVARGCSNKEVAQQLSISARTVQHHTVHIYDKLCVSTRAAAALFAMENDLLKT
ncbi:HD domain-containing phosphohydrolase [Pyxidicoccus sp. MSG2]|uniref:HD domain-containing phosphohydrolase n=1 Tax=Pyxidicoccus sp. MSG2 TaxID=2996790 RepID=UPI0022713C53|nr:HD domain-containing phosphohydrolase [Pyxidicoccus sp. MSG2]MCY1020102.1 LuxR C-terminal-related transcriptional regulator [Pyxidicoccus sp. MSG2]